MYGHPLLVKCLLKSVVAYLQRWPPTNHASLVVPSFTESGLLGCYLLLLTECFRNGAVSFSGFKKVWQLLLWSSLEFWATSKKSSYLAGETMCWRRSSRECDWQLTFKLDPGNKRLLIPYPVLGMYILRPVPQREPFERTQLWENDVLMRPSREHTC